MSEVNITELSNKVVIDDETSVVEISAPGPQGAAGQAGSAFTPAADSGSGSAVSGSFTVAGGTNITTAVSGTTVTVNADLAGTVTSVTPQGDNGSGTAITGSGNIKVAGTAPISTNVVGDTITVTHDNASGAGTSTGFPAAIEIDSKGHVVSVGSSAPPAQAANNLSDLANAGTARTNLGLGSSSTLDVPSSGNAASGEVVKGSDTRLSDARTPTTTLDHDAAKITSGTLAVARIPDITLSKVTDSGGAAALDVGTGAGTVCAGNDARLSDARTPTSHNHSASEITSGTLAVARGGTGSATAPMVGVITAADAAAARTVLSLGTAATSATGDFEASGSIASHNAITTAHGISSFGATLVDDANAAAARTTLGAAGTNHTHTLANITDSGTAAALDVGITSNDVLQVSTSGVTANEFLRLEALGTKVISRTAAEVLADIGAQAALTSPVTSPAMTGVSAGSITGVIKCSQSQYDAITPDANTLYVIV